MTIEEMRRYAAEKVMGWTGVGDTYFVTPDEPFRDPAMPIPWWTPDEHISHAWLLLERAREWPKAQHPLLCQRLRDMLQVPPRALCEGLYWMSHLTPAILTRAIVETHQSIHGDEP